MSIRLPNFLDHSSSDQGEGFLYLCFRYLHAHCCLRIAASGVGTACEHSWERKKKGSGDFSHCLCPIEMSLSHSLDSKGELLLEIFLFISEAKCHDLLCLNSQ